MPFKFDSQTVFLTYSRCDADVNELIEFFNSIKPVQWCRIAKEHHEDGGEHRHAVIKFVSRLQTRNERLFDFKGFHPEFKPVRSIKAALEYVAKEQHIDHGSIPGSKRDWTAIEAAAAGPEREWLRVCHEERIQPHIAHRLRALHNSSFYDLDEYDDRPLSDKTNLIPQQYTSLLVVGAPGIGKTGWAMKYAPRPALLVKHLDILRHFRPDYHKSIVFDDIKFQHMPRETQMQVADAEDQLQIHVRYGVAIIPRKVPRLFLCNYNNEPFIDDEAIQGRRVQRLYL